MEVKGRDLVTGIPQNRPITAEEVREAISEQVESHCPEACVLRWNKRRPNWRRTLLTGASC